MLEIGVERHGIAALEVVGLAVDLEPHGALEHEAHLAAAGLVHAIASGNAGAARELVFRDGDTLSGEIRRDERYVVAIAAGGGPFGRAHDGRRRCLVEAQELREREIEPVRDTAGGGERGRRLAALDLREHRSGDAAARREVAQRQLHPLAQALDTGADDRHLYTIADRCMSHSAVRCLQMPRLVRMLVPIAVLLVGAVGSAPAAARAPVSIEVALTRGAHPRALIRSARGLHTGSVATITNLRVLVLRSRHPARLIERLRPLAGVAAIARARAFLPSTDTEIDLDSLTGIPYSWAYDAVAAGPAIAAVGGGSSFPVAVVDTGVDVNEPDLAGRISTLRHDTASGGSDVTDHIGHGTMVAGVISMVDGNGIGGRGIAGATQVVPIRVTTTGVFFSDAVARSIVWAVNHGVRVINLSLGGHDLESPALTRALAYASDHDALLVAAAGNDGDRGNQISYPAAQLGAAHGGWSTGLSVAATRPDGSAAAFSTFNRFVSVAAPGAGAADCPGGVFSTLPSEGAKSFADDPANCDSLFGVPGDAVGGRYAYAQGTSFSAPIVSAVAALVLQANPALHADQVADVIRRSAHQTVGAGWNPHTGDGVVDALAAVTLARQYDTVAPALTFGVAREGSSVIASVAGEDRTGSGEALAGPGRSTVETSTDGRDFHVRSAARAASLRSTVPLRPGARIWVEGTTCDALHNCATRVSGPFHGVRAAPAVRFALSGSPGHVFHLKVHLTSLANSYSAAVRLESWNGHAYRLFQTVRLPFGGTVIAKEHVAGAGLYRLRARLVRGPSGTRARPRSSCASPEGSPALAAGGVERECAGRAAAGVVRAPGADPHGPVGGGQQDAIVRRRLAPHRHGLVGGGARADEPARLADRLARALPVVAEAEQPPGEWLSILRCVVEVPVFDHVARVPARGAHQRRIRAERRESVLDAIAVHERDHALLDALIRTGLDRRRRGLARRHDDE